MASKPENRPNSRPSAAGIIILLGLFFAAVAVMVGLPYYQAYVAPWRQTVIQVGEARLDMRAFVQRLRLMMDDKTKDKLTAASRVLEQMEHEEIIRQAARAKGLEVSQQELDRAVRLQVNETASGKGEFEDLYADLLRGLNLRDRDFRKILEADLYRSRLLADMAAKLPDSAPQLHLRGILTASAAQAQALRAQILAGENMAQLAKEKSLDRATGQDGGDMGWFPKGVNTTTAQEMVEAIGILAKTEPEAREVIARLEAGADFAALARRLSTDPPSREQDGFLGWSTLDSPQTPAWAHAASQLEKGALSGPVATAMGYWVVRLTDRSPGGLIVDEIMWNREPGLPSPPLATQAGFYILRADGPPQTLPLSADQKEAMAESRMKTWLSKEVNRLSEAGKIKWKWDSKTFNWAMEHL